MSPSGVYVRTAEHRRMLSENATKGMTEERKQEVSIFMSTRKHSEETKRKISKSLMGNQRTLGYKQTKEHKHKISEANKGNQYGLGHKHSEETKHKMSESHIGLVRSEEQKRNISESKRGENNPNYGKIFSEERKMKISEALTGSKNPSWKGGISFEPYCHKFNFAKKEEVRNQHLRTCVISGESLFQNRARLSIHHVDENKQQGCDGSNWQLVPVTKTWNGRLNNEQACLLLNLLLIKNKSAQINYNMEGK